MNREIKILSKYCKILAKTIQGVLKKKIYQFQVVIILGF